MNSPLTEQEGELQKLVEERYQKAYDETSRIASAMVHGMTIMIKFSRWTTIGEFNEQQVLKKGKNWLV